ncbi:MAG TPA: MarR family transcriptional regulator [Candidatus Sulfotelmatobacter sp.]|nr:MarR family transcriptional regulator [Candidatus Sulfotelmatobacter sp.]
MRYLGPGLSPARFAALSTIGSNPGISQSALGALLNIAGPSVVKVVDELEGRGLVSREATSDRRVYALHLTAAGTQDFNHYQATIEKFEEEIAARLSADEREKLITLLRKVAAEEA